MYLLTTKIHPFDPHSPARCVAPGSLLIKAGAAGSFVLNGCRGIRGVARDRGSGVVPKRKQAFSVSSRLTTEGGFLPGYRKVTHGSPRLLCVLLAIGLATNASLMPAFCAQTLTDEVHVSPRRQSHEDPSSEDQSLKAHSQPIKVDVHLVLLPVTITDLMNRPVTGLGRDNFRVFEGKEPQDIRHFSGEDMPVSLGVIFDTSGSMASKFDRAREAIVEFCKTANPQDEFFMIAFSDKPDQVSDFTSSVEDIQGKLLYTMPKGRTALLDAIYFGINKMRQAKYQKKALLIISDGGDNRSRYTEGEIKSLVKEGDVLIYAIGIYDHYFPTEEERLGPQLLDDITRLTGGRAFTVDNPNDLADIATKIGIELRNQYVLGYRPKNFVPDGKWHKVKVKLVPPRGLPPLQVHAKAGYYAPSE
jgi:Ca-activated chloride channel homolog